jgi:hypothetical protein
MRYWPGTASFIAALKRALTQARSLKNFRPEKHKAATFVAALRQFGDLS